jgi:hypothetical protein
VPTGAGPRSIRGGADFNGDGYPDLAVANHGSNSVTILLGNGAGGFIPSPAGPITVGLHPSGVVIGDWNADGIADLAVANEGSNTVSILIGDGTGHFIDAIGSPIIVGMSPVSIDRGHAYSGSPMAVANRDSNTVTLLSPNGSGGYAATSTLPVGNAPSSVAFGNFNDDAYDDLVVANRSDNTVTILLGPTYDPTSTIAVGAGPVFVATGNFNGDNWWDDLVVVNHDSSSLSILFADPYFPGAFIPAAGSPISVGAGPESVARVSGSFPWSADGRYELGPAFLVVNSIDNNVTSVRSYRSSDPLSGTDIGFTQSGASTVATGYAPAFLFPVANGFAVTNEGSDNVTFLLAAGSAPAPDGTICDDSNPCIQSKTCQQGACIGTFAPDGTSCDDGNPCTGPDVCYSGLCKRSPSADGTACNTGNACVQNSTCQSAQCAGTISPDGAPCDDGNPCTSADACSSGVCSGTPVPSPAEVDRSVRVSRAGTDASVTWNLATGATTSSVLRGQLSSLPVGSMPSNETCLASRVPIPTAAAIDPDVPPEGSGFWYLIRGENACGAGPYGYQGFNGVPTVLEISTSCP